MNLQKFYLTPIGAVYNYSAHRILKFIKLLADVSHGKSVLDVGAGEAQYKKYFERSVYKAQDICNKDDNYKYKDIDIKSDIYTIPLNDESVDYILCTEVLEHLVEPYRAFKEFTRLLKKGGELWLIAPFIWEEHEIPFDYMRYTRYFYENAAKINGLQVVEIKPMGGRFITFGYLFKDIVPNTFTNPFFYKLSFIVWAPVSFVFNIILHLLDKVDKSKKLTLQYECIFRKI